MVVARANVPPVPRNHKLVKPMVRKRVLVALTARVLGEVGVSVLVRLVLRRTEPAIRKVVRWTIPAVLPIRGTRALAPMTLIILV